MCWVSAYVGLSVQFASQAYMKAVGRIECVWLCGVCVCALCMKTRCVGRWWYAEQCLPWCGPCASTTTAAAATSASTWRGASSQTTTNPTDSVSPSACVCHLNWFKLNLVSSVFITKYVYKLMCFVMPWGIVFLSPSQEIPLPLWNPKVRYRVHNSPSLLSVLN